MLCAQPREQLPDQVGSPVFLQRIDVTALADQPVRYGGGVTSDEMSPSLPLILSLDRFFFFYPFSPFSLLSGASGVLRESKKKNKKSVAEAQKKVL